jgi:methylated-DNA-[protein]-cysteine S-methyltransferase
MSTTPSSSALTHLSYTAPFGELVLVSDGDLLVRLLLPNDARTGIGEPGSDAVLEQTASQLDEYFAGTRRDFTVPLSLKGTEFQLRVWNALCNIDYGNTASYAEIAAAIGNPKAVRAIGGANHSNPVPIIIPCHRVIGADGSLVGYGGGLEVKTFLLNLEGNAQPAFL